MKTYRGTNERVGLGGFRVEVSEDGGPWLPLPPRNDLVDHSPTGLAWGYHGSGAAQLALALLADLCDDGTALRYYQAFKRAVVAQLPFGQGWELGQTQLEIALRAARIGYEGRRA